MVSVELSWGPACALIFCYRDLDEHRWRHLIGRMVPDVGRHLDFSLLNPTVVERLSTPISFSVFTLLLLRSSALLRSICCNTLLCFSATANRYGMNIFSTVLASFFPAEFRVCCAYVWSMAPGSTLEISVTRWFRLRVLKGS